MTVYTDKDAKGDFDSVLDEARAQGEVRIKRQNGQEFSLRAVKEMAQPPVASNNALKRRDLSDLAGSWVDDPEFERAMIDQDQIDPALWK